MTTAKHYRESYREHRAALNKCKLTDEEKARWEPLLIDEWQGIAPDAMQACREGGSKRITKGEIVEYVMTSISSCRTITPEEYEFLSSLSCRPVGTRWLNQVLGGYAGAL